MFIARQVPIGRLGGDLRSGHVPAFNWVIPDECHDQHGDPPYCIDSGSTGGSDPQDQRLVAFGDHYLGQLVAQITSASFWAKGNNAIDIVYDEGDNNVHGGGRVADVVVTSHGPRHLRAPAFYSHYSLLQTTQGNFSLPCLQNTCHTATVKPLAPLFAVTGSAAMPFKPLPVPSIAALSPAPKEPVRYTTSTASGAGWAVQRAPFLGTSDNSFGAVAAVSPHQAWAAGNFLPDAKGSNPDATLATAARFNGSRWVHTPVPNSGPNFNTLFGVAATSQKAWAVGVALNRFYFAHSLIEAWDGTTWKIARTPRLNSLRDILFSAAAASSRDVWAVGEQQDKAGTFRTLAERWNGRRWTVVQLPTAGLTGSLLQGVAIGGHQVWAVGQSDDAVAQARPLVEHLSHGKWTAQQPAGLGTGFSNVTGVAVVHRTAWLVGSALDEASGNQLTVVARNAGSRSPRRTRVAATGSWAGYRPRAAPPGRPAPSTPTPAATR
jgi:hypothetical protein